ncbi:hypothetical protein SGFS_098520 [Streptomyces graminofaciens]|uniref:Uncharacterized protein n=1 Tax=Streptomyces graminofaciens TaxID=68212 RepID=A0ABM7FQE1_9ACTN|nr:hypothetical protein SGFS_098520 [Streptomyces graminofaciens]
MSPDAPDQGAQAGQDRQRDQHDTDWQARGRSTTGCPVRAFRNSVEAGDFAAPGELLAEDIALRSPVSFKPY